MAALSVASLPSGARGRALAVALTLALALLLWLVALQPLLDSYAAAADTLSQRRSLAGRMGDLVDTLPQLRRAAAAMATQAAPAAATVDGATDAVAGAALQGLLETMASNVGAHLTSSEALPSEAAGAYRRLGLRVSVDAKWPVLIALLQEIERATPRMFVDDLQLHAQPVSDKTNEPVLDIAFTLSAFRSLQPKPAAAPTGASPVAVDPNAADPAPPSASPGTGTN